MTQKAPPAAPSAEMFTKPKGDRNETYIRNADTKKTVRVTVRSICHNPRMNVVRTYDVFPKQEKLIGDEAPGAPNIRRNIVTVTYTPAPGKAKDQ